MKAIFEDELGLDTPDVRASDVKRYLKEVSEAKQAIADAQMENARLQKAAKKAGINTEAIKILLKLQSQDKSKSKVYLSHLFYYARVANLWGQLDLFEEKPTDIEAEPESAEFEEPEEVYRDGAKVNP